MKATLSVQLGVFEVDLLAGELRDGDRVHRLQEQPFQILSMLIARGGQVVTRNDIRQKLERHGGGVRPQHQFCDQEITTGAGRLR
jgi:DNA-binding response OmpR family regulator